MYQLTPKSKWRTFLHCCNCSKSDGEAGILSQMATGWTEATCLRMNALAAEGHSHVATSAEQKRHDNLWRISLNCSRSNTSTTFPNVPTFKKSWQNFMRRRKRKPSLPDKFSIPTVSSRTEFDSVRSKKCNLKERAQVMEAQEKLLLGPSIVVHRGRVGGLHPTQNGWHCTFRFFSQRCRRVSLAQNSDLPESVGWKDDVSSTLAAVAQHTHVLSRVLWLGEQH